MSIVYLGFREHRLMLDFGAIVKAWLNYSPESNQNLNLSNWGCRDQRHRPRSCLASFMSGWLAKPSSRPLANVCNTARLDCSTEIRCRAESLTDLRRGKLICAV